MKRIAYIMLILCLCNVTRAQDLLFVEYNCENLFDCKHDSLKNDQDFCEGGRYNWTPGRFWRKLNNIGKAIISCGGEGDNWQKPDLVALIEVENDSALTWLTQRSCLRDAQYKYVMTDSPDARGIDVALLYDENTFRMDGHHSIRIPKFMDHKATRDILYARMISASDGKPFHVFVAHLPSRNGGEQQTAPYRNFVSDILCHAVDSVLQTDSDARIFVTGDFNDYASNQSVKQLDAHNMTNISANAEGRNGAKGTYRYQGEWGSLDQMLISHAVLSEYATRECHINDAPFLVQNDEKYGGVKPYRTYSGPRYDADGTSDHLPLVMRLSK